MRAPTPLPGLPIGRGEVWREPWSRTLLLALACTGLLPLAGLVTVAAGWIAPPSYVGGAVLPAIALVSAGLAIAAFRQRHLLVRAAVGMLAGWLGVLAFDALVVLLQTFGPGRGPAIVWAGIELAPGAKALDVVLPAYAHHWLATGAFWGMTYALVAGRAHWGWGVVYGAALWATVVGVALGLPHGTAVVTALDLGRASLLLVGHVAFGAVLGAVNQVLQPEPPLNAKIVFLRDYVAHRERHPLAKPRR
jgi:hypothetical protein